MSLAAASMPAASVIAMPERISASGMLGVSTAAQRQPVPGTEPPLRQSAGAWAPEVATITGSTTMFSALYSLSFAAITAISSAEETMPILHRIGKDVGENSVQLLAQEARGGL